MYNFSHFFLYIEGTVITRPTQLISFPKEQQGLAEVLATGSSSHPPTSHVRDSDSVLLVAHMLYTLASVMLPLRAVFQSLREILPNSISQCLLHKLEVVCPLSFASQVKNGNNFNWNLSTVHHQAVPLL